MSKQKKIIQYILMHWWLLILLFLAAPIVINFLMKPWWFWIPLKPVGDVNSWIGFWGNYTGGLLGALIGGIVAYYIAKSQIEAQNKSEQDKYIYDRRMSIFKTIMENRAIFLGNQVANYDFVKAINQIEIEFSDKEKVIESWKNLYTTLCSQINNDAEQIVVDAFANKKNEQFVNLLFEMTLALNLNMNKDALTNTVYLPKSYLNSVSEQQVFKQKVEDLLDGKTSLSIDVKHTAGIIRSLRYQPKVKK
jgi:hypothetical protein